MAWIDTVDPAGAGPALRAANERVERERGEVAALFRASSLNPDATAAHLEFYVQTMHADSPLSRRERELVATVVSRANGSVYCLAHHADAFGRHASEPGLQALVATDHTKAPLSTRERAIADHAVKLALRPASVTRGDVDALRKAGLDDRAVLDLTLAVAYVSFANRLASGLGVEADDVAGRYRY